MTDGIVFKTHDNTVTLTFTDDGAAVDLSSNTKIEVIINGTTIDSVATPTAFDQTNAATGVILLDFGSQSITVGSYAIRVIIYDATNTNGVVWAHENASSALTVKVV